MCRSCYLVQADIAPSAVHQGSIYWRELSSLPPMEMARKMLAEVSNMHLKVRCELSNGRYDWFKPIYGSSIQEYMIKANKELQEVVDNGNLIRGQTTKKMHKEGKILTYQANEPIQYSINQELHVYENIDQKGQVFVEYSFGPIGSISNWVKSTSNKNRIYCKEDYDKYITSPNLLMKHDFHLIIIGLDRVSLTVKELYQEILIKIRTTIGGINPENIMILDNYSIIGKPGPSNSSWNSKLELVWLSGRY